MRHKNRVTPATNCQQQLIILLDTQGFLYITLKATDQIHRSKLIDVFLIQLFLEKSCAKKRRFRYLRKRDRAKDGCLQTSNIWMRPKKLKKGSCNCIIPFLNANAASELFSMLGFITVQTHP